MAIERIIIQGGEVWRGGAGLDSWPTSPMEIEGDLGTDDPVAGPYSVSVSAGAEHKPNATGINLSGIINSGRGQSDVDCWIPPEGFAAIISAMMKADPDATRDAFGKATGDR